MNDKAVATFVVSLLVATALLACVPCGSQGAGAINDPLMLSSDTGQPRILYAGQTMTAYFGTNWNSYINPSVSIDGWTSDSADGAEPASGGIRLMDSNVSTGAQPYGNGVTASVSQVPYGTGFNGVYRIDVSATSNVEAADLFHKFKVALKETVGPAEDTMVLYYAIHLMTTGPCVVLIEGTYGQEVVTLDNDTPYQMTVKNGEEYNHTGFFFYAEGLPDGMNMRLDGILEGKAAGHLVRSQPTGTATLYAVSKLDATEVHSSTLNYSLVQSDSFTYTVDVAGESTISCFDDGYAAIGNTQPLVVTIHEPSGSVFDKNNYSESSLIIDGSEVRVEFQDNTVTLNDDLVFEDITGIVQLHLVKKTGEGGSAHVYESILHIMVTGPVVHSGLSPSVTSA